MVRIFFFSHMPKNLTASQILWIFATILLLVFVAQNLETTPVRFIVWTFNTPTFLIIIVAYLVWFYTSIITGAGMKKFFSSDQKGSEEVGNHPSEKI